MGASGRPSGEVSAHPREVKAKVTQLCPTLRHHGLYSGIYSPWNSSGQNTGVGSLSLFQGIFPTQGSNPSLPHCGRILYQLSHEGSLRLVGSLSLLQQIFLTQESNWGLLHCRWILYQLSYEGNQGKQDSSLGGHKQNPVHTRTQRKGAVRPRKAEPELPASAGSPPVEVWAAGLPRDRATGGSPGRSPLHKRSWRSPLSLSQSL